ncbi:MAG: hypothetical protein E6Q97_11425 [Desulfurellales bacterium]|nr:MAG: hypothetical protein E6Q97_11425 [Desulfurellales bacterium]
MSGTPEQRREQQRKYRAKRRLDPVKLAHFQAKDREYTKRYRQKRTPEQKEAQRKRIADWRARRDPAKVVRDKQKQREYSATHYNRNGWVEGTWWMLYANDHSTIEDALTKLINEEEERDYNG